MDDLGTIILCIGLPIFILFVLSNARAGKRKRIEEARIAYQSSLKALKFDPTNATLKQQTLSLGRVYARAVREGGSETVFDEMALSNDLSAATASASASSSLASSSTSASVEKRLSDLASLREKGLIDEEEYARKREQILSDL
jgi:hypothetical protein